MERKITCWKCGTVNESWLARCEKCREDLHKRRLGARFWVAIALGVIGTVALVCVAALLTLFGEAEMLLLPLVPLSGLALCRKLSRVAGILLIIGGILPVAPVFSSLDPDNTLVLVLLLIMVGPLIASGILFVRMKV